MTDDDPRRPWHFRQLKWSLQLLAQAGSVQPTLFPEQAPGPDDLAFGFDHWASVVRDTYAADLSPAQETALDAIAAKLTTMSRDGTEFDVELWTDAALETSEHWSDVRLLAVSALEAFGWVVNPSPDDAHDEAGPS
jgi:hypothetical protein